MAEDSWTFPHHSFYEGRWTPGRELSCSTGEAASVQIFSSRLGLTARFEVRTGGGPVPVLLWPGPTFDPTTLHEGGPVTVVGHHQDVQGVRTLVARFVSIDPVPQLPAQHEVAPWVCHLHPLDPEESHP